MPLNRLHCFAIAMMTVLQGGPVNAAPLVHSSPVPAIASHARGNNGGSWKHVPGRPSGTATATINTAPTSISMAAATSNSPLPSTTSVPGYIYMTTVPGEAAYVMRTMGDDGEYATTTYATRMTYSSGAAMTTASVSGTAGTATSAAGYIYETALPSSSTAYVMRTVTNDGGYATTTYAMAAKGIVTMVN